MLDGDWQDMKGQNNDGSPHSQPDPGRVQPIADWDGDNMSLTVDPASILPRRIGNLPTALSDFFVREAIPLYCAWDSKLNFMRIVVENAWQSSEVLYHTMENMAAACLASSILELSWTAAQERVQALQCLEADSPPWTSNQEARLLATFLLGHTASWHDPRNLAKETFQATQKLVYERMATDEAKDAKPMARFFQAVMDYWEMLLSYVTAASCTTDQPYGGPFIGPEEPPADQPFPTRLLGYPEQTARTLTDIGKLVFQYRKRASSIKFVTETDLDVFKNQIRDTRRLEKRLLAYKPADASKIQDIGDPTTQLGHLSNIGEACRCVALLQIYRVFSGLLVEYNNPWDNSDIFFAASNELRCGRQDVASLGWTDDRAREMGHNAIELARARSFVKARLSAYADVLLLRKIINILELVTHIWGGALDARELEVYWLDVCNQKQLGTLMG
ncbi:hypothetical protein ACJ41O_003397 [Fusarium nematophilum]